MTATGYESAAEVLDAVKQQDHGAATDARQTTLALINFADDFALGTRAIAGYVRERGFTCDMIFMKRLAHNSASYQLDDRHYDRLIDMLTELDPTVIGLSVATRVLPFAEEASRRIRAAFPDAVLLWGGWHATMAPDRVLRSVDVDGVAVGESELTVLEILERVEAGESLDGIPGLRREAGVKVPQRPLIQDLDTVPYFRYEARPSFAIENDGIHLFDSLPSHYGSDRYGYPMLTSRGCPYNCSFCSVPFMKGLYADTEGRFLRRRSIASVIAELQYARDVLGANYIWFFDEELLFHRKWMLKFLPEFRDKVGLQWYCEAHPDSFREPEFIELLDECGLSDLEIGLQSASEKTMKLFNRPHRQRALLPELSKAFARSRISVSYDIILDNQLEEEEDTRTTFEYLLSLERPFQAQMFPLAFREDYPLTKHALDLGAITEEDYEHNVFEQTREEQPGKDVSDASRIGEFPFVRLGYMNCLIYLTQVDFFPKSWIRRMSRSDWWREHERLLARLVLFLERSHLGHIRFTARRRLRQVSTALRSPGSFLGFVSRRLTGRDNRAVRPRRDAGAVSSR